MLLKPGPQCLVLKRECLDMLGKGADGRPEVCDLLVLALLDLSDLSGQGPDPVPEGRGQVFAGRRAKAGTEAVYADVEVTAQVFLRLIRAADDTPQFCGLTALVKAAGRTARCNIPVQANLF